MLQSLTNKWMASLLHMTISAVFGFLLALLTTRSILLIDYDSLIGMSRTSFGEIQTVLLTLKVVILCTTPMRSRIC